MKRRPVRITVSDHAVVRYLERGLGIDVDAIRAHIAKTAEDAAALGATCLQTGTIKIALSDQMETDAEGVHLVSIPTILDRAMVGDIDGEHRRRKQRRARAKKQAAQTAREIDP